MQPRTVAVSAERHNGGSTRDLGLYLRRPNEGGHFHEQIMVGYHGWTSERATINDATIPILADGIKWLGYSPKLNLVWNVGYFGIGFRRIWRFQGFTVRL